MANDVGVPVWLIGNVGKDAESKTVGSDTEMLTFSIAVKRSAGKDQDAISDWYDAVVWKGYARALAGRIKKGDRLFVTGHLAINKYKDKNNVDRVSMRLHVDRLEWVYAKWPDADGSSGSDPGYGDDYEAPNF